MTNTNEIISKLKEVRKQKDLSYGDIIELMKKNGDYLSKSTISRVFQDDSENVSFRYEETIRDMRKHHQRNCIEKALIVEKIYPDGYINPQRPSSLGCRRQDECQQAPRQGRQSDAGDRYSGNAAQRQAQQARYHGSGRSGVFVFG